MAVDHLISTPPLLSLRDTACECLPFTVSPKSVSLLLTKLQQNMMICFQGMSNIVRSQGQQPRMSQALINVVMPGSPITSGQRPAGGPPQQPNMRLMGPTSFTSTTTVSTVELKFCGHFCGALQYFDLSCTNYIRPLRSA